MKYKTSFFKYKGTFFYLAVGLSILALALFPAFFARSASASQLTSRSLTISSGIPSASSVSYTFAFTVPSTSQVQGLKFQACTNAVGSCSGPGTLSFSSATFTSQTGWQGATNFAVDGTGANDCTASASVLCANRSDATSQTASSAKTIKFGTITNPASANTAFFVRITTYSTTNYTVGGTVDTGTVASAVVQTLTVNAAVAEILNFCVGSTTVDDATSSIAGDCTGVSGTSVNLGTLDSSKISITPETTNCSASDCTKNGIAMLRTNASSGATVSYDSVQQSGTRHLGTLRISGQTCSTDGDNANTSNTDACFNVRTTQATFSTGTERFGMTVAGVNCGSTTSYTCTFGSGTYNLARDAAYDCDGSNTYPTTDLDQISGPTTCGYAWDESGAMTQIASSTGSTTKQVDDEALVLKFAATPILTTPFGAYTALADFVAVATY